MGTRDLRMALILRASPFPAWINCRNTHNASRLSIDQGLDSSGLGFLTRRASYVHLWSTASQQVYEGRVEGHDGIAQVHPVLLVLLLSSEPGQRIAQSEIQSEILVLIRPHFVHSLLHLYCIN